MNQTRQIPLLSRLTISTRLRLILGIQIVALIITISAIAIILPQIFDGFAELSNAQNDLLISANIETQVLEARRREKDFFLRYNNIGYETALSLYSDAHSNSIESINIGTSQLANVDANPDEFDLVNEEIATSIEPFIENYTDNFNSVTQSHIPDRTNSITTILNEFSQLDEIAAFQGHARTISSLRDLENQFTIYHLRLVPAHATYDEFLVVYEEIIADFDASRISLLDTIEAATISERVKDDLRVLIANVELEFEHLNTIDLTIAEKIRDLRDAIHSVEPLVVQLIQNADSHFQTVNDNFTVLLNNMSVLIIAAVIVSSIIILILVTLINQSILEPIDLLTTATDDMASGNYKKRIVYDSTDELGQLAMSFNQMGDAIQQRNLQLNQALEEAHEANRLKDEFLATMSHELRTPLNAIIGFLGIVTMTANLNEKNTHRLNRATVNSKRLLGLINNILDISRIEARRMKITKSPVDIRDLAEDLKSQLDVLIEEKDVEFMVTIDDNVPDEILTDEDAVTKIITNLSGNAMKFTEQGQVHVNIFVNDAQKTWSIKVTDTGIGIPIHMQETIFDRFRQVDGSSTREYGGSGLGLASLGVYAVK